MVLAVVRLKMIKRLLAVLELLGKVIAVAVASLVAYKLVRVVAVQVLLAEVL